MCESPGEGMAGLVVELDDGTEPTTLRETVADAGGEIQRELPFDCWLIRVPETGVDAVCSLPGVVRVETEATLEHGVDETLGDVADEK